MLLIPILAWSQQRLSIHDCLEAAVANHPRSGDSELIDQISTNKLINLKSQWRPSLDLNGQMTYQSDVTQINVELPFPGVNFPVAPKDQYKIYLDLHQTIFDGGRISQQQKIEEISMESSEKELEIKIQEVKSEVIDLFYSLLNMQENVKILRLSKEILAEKKNLVESGIRNGILMESDLLLLELELTSLEQEIQNALLMENSMTDMLNQKCGFVFDENFILESSELSFTDISLNRKELELFDLQKNILAANVTMKDKSRLPLLFAFGQLGYGNPGLNMLNDQFDTYYYVGAGLTWNIWDWNSSKRDKESILLQSSLIDSRRDEFEKNIKTALTNQESVILTHEENIRSLEEMVKLRLQLTEIYESQLKDGVIKTADYLEVSNKLKIAKIKLGNEQILLQKAIAYYNYLNGEL